MPWGKSVSFFAFLSLILVVSAAETKPAAASGDNSTTSASGNPPSKMSPDSRNGEFLLDQIAEESSRITEVEVAAEKSYATATAGSGLPLPQQQQQQPPPIPVPVPVQVRPGAIVLPSPGSGNNNNNHHGNRKPPPGMPNNNNDPNYQMMMMQQLQGAATGGGAPYPKMALPPPPPQLPVHPQQQQLIQPPPPPPPPPGAQPPPGAVSPGSQRHQVVAMAPPPPPMPPPLQVNPHPPPPPGDALLLGAATGLVGVGEPGGGVLRLPPPPPPPPLPPHPQLDATASFHVTTHQQEGAHWPNAAPEVPQILHLEAKCEKNLMKVVLKFDRPFFGVIFSKGQFDNKQCVYVEAGQGRTSAAFDIAINGCGTTGNTQNGLYGYGEQSGSGSYFENTVVVQYDPMVQEVWDQARKLRCSWHDFYEKSVTFKPFNVEMLDIVHTDFAGDNVGCWMQIQAGKGPWANEVSGIVKIGQTLTMVLAIKDEENKFDMLVRDCVAHDGKRHPIHLVDDRGCISRPKLMSRFTKIKNFGTSASVMSYAHFQAFKFPDSMDVHFQCTIQICRHQCPEQCASPDSFLEFGGGGGVPARGGGLSASTSIVSAETLQKPAAYAHSGGRPRLERRSAASILFQRHHLLQRRSAAAAPSAKSIGVNGNIKVVSTGDLAFSLENNGSGGGSAAVVPSNDPQASTGNNNGASGNGSSSTGLICISTPSFTVTLVFLLAILVLSCILSTFLCIRHRTLYHGAPASSSSSSSTCSTNSGTPNPYKHHRPTLYDFLRKTKY